MEITTKFNLGDYVYPIIRSGYNGFKKCETCGGNGYVTIKENGKEIDCPECYGEGGHEEWISERWMVSSESLGMVGKVSAELYYDDDNGQSRYTYMLSSTGIRSGTVWYEKDLFLTKEEAQTECDLRNEIKSE